MAGTNFYTDVMLDNDNVVPRAVFLRDPLERLLSGYLDKCVKPNIRKSQGHCEPNVVFGVDHLWNRKDTVDMGTERQENVGQTRVKGGIFATYVDLLQLKWNVHFVPQLMAVWETRTIGYFALYSALHHCCL